MKKIKISAIIIIAIAGCYLIYNHFDKINKNTPVINKFGTEYNLVETPEQFKYSTIDEIINILSSGTGIVFFCTPDSEWCQHYAYYLDKSIENDIEINYLNIKDYRQVNSIKYQRLIELLDNYLIQDDSNNKKIYMPDLTFVNNGTIVAHNNDTSLVSSEITIDEYWNNNKIKEFKEEMINNVKKMKEELPTNIVSKAHR